MEILKEYASHMWKVMPALLKGAGLTIQVTAFSVLFGLIIGLIICLSRMSKRKWLNLPALAYIDVVRGTPLMVQILMVYYGIPGLLTALIYGSTGPTVSISALMAGVIACSINSGAYVAEIIRGGIQSVDSGQMEAARSLGMTHFQSMVFIILPQAFRNIVPPMGNEFIVLLKDSSLLMIIGVNELMHSGELYAASSYAFFPAYLAIALVYLLMTFSISRFFGVIERRMRVSDRSTQTA